MQHPNDPSLAVAPQLTISPYYAIPRAFVHLFGESEAIYRIPSLLLMAIALFVVARLAARLIHPNAAWFAVFACLAFGNFDYNAAEARPYALGICVVCLAIYFLVQWLDTASIKHGLLFLFLAAFLWWVHLVYWVVYPVFVFYTAWRLVTGGTKVTWLFASALFLVLGLSLLPVAFYSLTVLRGASAHNFAPMPRFRGIPFILDAPVAVVIFGVVWLVALIRRWPLKRPAAAGVLLPGVWWLWIPLCLFVYSRASGNVLTASRYVSPMLPGAALTSTALAGLYLPERYWRRAALVLALGVLLIVTDFRQLAIGHSVENWRQASYNADLAAEEPDTPVLMVTPYIEGQPPVWRPDYKLPGFLYAPLDFYPLRGKVYPLAFQRSAEADDFATRLVRDTLSRRNRFIVYGAGRNCIGWIRFLTTFPELKGWRVSEQGAGVVVVSVFDNPAASLY